MADLRLERLSKSYRDRRREVTALRDLSMVAGDGQLVVLVGPSGCGKTTTLRLVAGLDCPTNGAIFINGRSVNDVEPKDRDIAMVFQNYALYPHMTVFKNMAFGLKMRGVAKAEIERNVRETALQLGIDHLLDRRPGSLSGGEKQRVALGRAVVRDPAVFLLDEPLSNLDVQLRLRMRTEIKSLQRRLNATMLYVTHDQEEAMTLADQLVVLKQGVLQQIGTPTDVYDRPVNRFVAGFFGYPPMNFVSGTIEQSGSKRGFRCALGDWPIERGNGANWGSSNRVVAGIRAEDVVLDSSDPTKQVGDSRASSNLISRIAGMTVRHVEPLGHCAIVHIEAAQGSTLIARTSPHAAPPVGERATVSIAIDRVHWFADDEGGRRIGPSASFSPSGDA